MQAAAPANPVAVWMGYILPELGQPIQDVLTISSDNQAALSLLAEKQHTHMSQHMEPIDSQQRWWVKQGRIRFSYVCTQDIWVDCLTRALPRAALEKCCAAMGLSGLVTFCAL